MSKLDKLLQRVRNNPKSVTLDELRTLLESYGFEFLRARGSHHSFGRLIGGRNVRLVIPYRKPHINPVYVRQVLAYIDEILAEES